MPWRESSLMSERLRFVQACLDRRKRIAEICSEFGISEKTGYKLLKRFREYGVEGLSDRTHVNLRHPHHISAEVRKRITDLRKAYPLYGAVTIRDWLTQHEPEKRWPAASSIGEILKQEKLIHPRRRHREAAHGTLESSHTRSLEPNMVWTADFKGQSRLGIPSGPYCYPLTALDLHTHYLLGCRALLTTSVASARQVFVRLFKEFGLPEIIRTDNGIPFAQPNALGRLGRLAFWWVRLGIRPEHITPARPAENGAHERFHRTLKAATMQPPSSSIIAQQQRFDLFRAEYNSDRPHHSLPGHRPPAAFYKGSPRPYPAKLPPIVYPEHSFVRLVDSSGNIKWRTEPIFLSGNLSGEYVSLTEQADHILTIAYGSLELGDYDCDRKSFTPRVRWNC